MMGVYKKMTIFCVWLLLSVSTGCHSGNVTINNIQDAVVVTNPIGIRLRYIPPGEYYMGSPKDELMRETDERRHKVKIQSAFYIGVTEVTQKQYESLMGENPSFRKGDNLPVERVRWDNAVEFCKKMSELHPEFTYRLPSESEWEYACRAGTTTRFYWGDDQEGKEIEGYAYYSENSSERAHAVGKKKPNPWGLYDMIGNVKEWCNDLYGEYPTLLGKPEPKNYWSEVHGVIRGGGFRYPVKYCRTARRAHIHRSSMGSALGFRVVAEPVENTK